MDIVGPMLLAHGQRKFLIVAVDYFSKWAEAEALASITEKAIIQFLWQNILCLYGVSCRLISDNGCQFQGHRIWKWCQNLKIEQAFTFVAHSQANGQVEVINKIIV